MPDLALTLKLAITGGPTWSITHGSTVEAYDVIDLVLDPATTDKVVELQPGTAARVKLLAIQSSLYGPEIRFKVTDGTTDSTALALLSPQLYGDGAAALFSVEPKALKLSNTHPAASGKKARIQILVGRDATP